MSGAVLVTLVSTLLVNLVGVARIARLLHLSFADTLPWGRLAAIFGCALVAALPVVWITRESGVRPIVALGAASAAYAAVYFGLSYLMVRLKADPTEDHLRIQAGTQPPPASGLDRRWGPALAGPEKSM
jgi:hypothetical protein